MISLLATLTRDPFFRPRAGGVVLAVVLALGGCAAPTKDAVSPEPEVPASGWTACESPRPKICTMEYAPVCARLDGENPRTYPSRCNACADIAVSAWRDAPCEES